MNIINITKQVMKEIEYRDALTDAISFIGGHMEKVADEKNVAEAKANIKNRLTSHDCENYIECVEGAFAEINAQAAAAKKIVEALKEYKAAVEGGTPINAAEANSKE